MARSKPPLLVKATEEEQSAIDNNDIIRLLIRRQIELNSLLEVTQAINSNFSAATLFNMYEFMLKRHLHINKLALFIVDRNQWTCPLNYGTAVKFTKANSADWEQRLKGYLDITVLKEKDDELLGEFDLLIPVLHKKQPLAYILIGGYEKVDSGTDNEIKFIQTITNVIVVAIENKKLFREQLQQEGLKREMELAAQVQTMLVPAELPVDNCLEMASIYLPHHSIGGDYYDCIRLNDDELLFCIADVSGKGISAALLMANFQANLRALAQQDISLKELVIKLNKKVYSNTKGEKFITLFVAKYQCSKRYFQYINAGHNPPLLSNKKGINQLKTGTIILGAFEILPFINDEVLEIDEPSLLVCFTDGLIEAAEMNGKEGFDLYKLIAFMKEHQSEGARKFNDTLLETIDTNPLPGQFADDITVLSCKFF